MNKKYLLIGGFSLLQWISNAQQSKDTLKKKVNKTEIELVYNHYLQDGDNSAVTGGQGNEKMTVYGPSVSYKRANEKNQLAFQIGTDVISSASVDNINFVSSTSRVDSRVYLKASYQKNYDDWSLSAGSSGSIESDYLSIGTYVGLSKENKDNLSTFDLLFTMYNDDLRWGRLNKATGHKADRLIYPVELRYKEWFDTYRRNSFNLKSSSSFVLNKRNRLGFSNELSYQVGLLSTTFHRIIFQDESIGLETLPSSRFKGSLSAQWNTFINGRLILKNNISYYADTWDIRGIAISNETIVIINQKIRLAPNIRLYNQSGSDYFEGYQQHQIDEEFYTSDYDFSDFNSINLGMGLMLFPLKKIYKNIQFSKCILSYNFYARQDGLKAHILSASFLISR